MAWSFTIISRSLSTLLTSNESSDSGVMYMPTQFSSSLNPLKVMFLSAVDCTALIQFLKIILKIFRVFFFLNNFC